MNGDLARLGLAATSLHTDTSPPRVPGARGHHVALLRDLTQAFERLLHCVGRDALDDGEQPRPIAPSAPAQAAQLAASLKHLLQLRAHHRKTADPELFNWPSWDMLLDLAAVRIEGSHISVSSVCISSGAPQSTALRKLAALEEAGLIQRYFHGTDRRRVCITLSDKAFHLVATTLQQQRTAYTAMRAPA